MRKRNRRERKCVGIPRPVLQIEQLRGKPENARDSPTKEDLLEVMGSEEFAEVQSVLGRFWVKQEVTG